MDTTVAQIVLDEVFPALEALETQNRAILQFLKERGITSDKDLAPFMEQAAKTSGVLWRAARLRVDHLLSTAAKTEAPHEKPPVASNVATNTNKDIVQKAEEDEKRRAAEPTAEGERGAAQQKGDQNRGHVKMESKKPAGKDEHAA